MAAILLDGFDHLAANQLTSKGWSNNADSVQTGRFGSGQCIRLNGGSGTKTRSLPSNYSTVICGFALRTDTVGSVKEYFDIRAGATSTLKLWLDASSHIQIRNSSDTVIATGTTALNANTWYYIEVKLIIAGASGSVKVRLNGATEIATTTGDFSSTNVDTIALPDNGAQKDFDDLYVFDTSGANNNDFAPNGVRIGAFLPNGAGAHTQWTPSAGSNYTCTNEATPNDDTSYISDATVNDIDTYAVADITTAATILAIQHSVYARKDDGATRQIAMVTRQGGADTVHGTKTLGATYAYFSDVRELDPTGAAWTPTNLNADEFGVKVIA